MELVTASVTVEDRRAVVRGGRPLQEGGGCGGQGAVGRACGLAVCAGEVRCAGVAGGGVADLVLGRHRDVEGDRGGGGGRGGGRVVRRRRGVGRDGGAAGDGAGDGVG